MTNPGASLGCLGSTFGNSSPKTKTLAGVSMRAIGRRMGVHRTAVRAALVEAGLIMDDASDGS